MTVYGFDQPSVVFILGLLLVGAMLLLWNEIKLARREMRRQNEANGHRKIKPYWMVDVIERHGVPFEYVVRWGTLDSRGQWLVYDTYNHSAYLEHGRVSAQTAAREVALMLNAQGKTPFTVDHSRVPVGGPDEQFPNYEMGCTPLERPNHGG